MVLGRISSSTVGLISTPSPTMPCISTVQGPTFLALRTRRESSVKLRRQPLFGEFDAIALDARKRDFKMRAFLDRLDARDGLGRDDGRNHRLRREAEGNAENVGVFDVEQLLVVFLIGLAAQRAANDLFAQQLRAKGAHAQNMRDRIGVPAFGQHGDGDDAADGFAEPARLCRRCSSPRARDRSPKSSRLRRRSRSAASSHI